MTKKAFLEILLSCVILAIAEGGLFGRAKAQRGFYDDGGILLPCAPCPKRNLHLYLENQCVADFVDCPNLCRLPQREWRPDETAGREICDNLNPTKTAPSTAEDYASTQTAEPFAPKKNGFINIIVRKLDRLKQWSLSFKNKLPF